jgi:hypothetical protein
MIPLAIHGARRLKPIGTLVDPCAAAVSRTVVAIAAIATSSCCGSSVVEISFIPHGSDAPEMQLAVGDTLSFRIQAYGHASLSPWGNLCNLYDSTSDPERFTVTLSDSSIATTDGRSFVVARRPGTTVLSATTAGLPAIDLPIRVTSEGAVSRYHRERSSGSATFFTFSRSVTRWCRST